MGAQQLSTFYDYVLVESESRTVMDTAAVAKALAQYDAVFLGETHEHPAIHRAQFDLIYALYAQSVAVTVSMEQFERDTQSKLDQYLAGEIGEATLIRDARAWKNYGASYRPILELARDANWPVLAANAPHAIVRCVGREGPDYLDALDTDQRVTVASDLDLGDGAYRQKFFGTMQGSSSHGERTDIPDSLKRSYAAQVLRDETMAETIATHMTRFPNRTIVHLNGSFHSAGFLGTVERVARRAPEASLAVVHPVHVDDIADISDTSFSLGTFLLATRPPPERILSEAEQRAEIEAIMAVRSKNGCSS